MLTDEERKQRHKEACRRWEAKNRKKRNEYWKTYRATKSGKETWARVTKKYETTHPERRRAWLKAQTIPLGPCVICGSTQTHRHHPDPLKPLNVVMLCPLHHKQAHNV